MSALGTPLDPAGLMRGQLVDVVTRATVISVSTRRGSMVVRRGDGVAVRVPLDQIAVHDLPALAAEAVAP